MPLDTLPRLHFQPLPPSRHLQADPDGTIALIEVADGEPMIIGPIADPASVEREAMTLLAATGPGAYLPPLVHRLCLAYLAARRVKVLP